MAPATAGVDSLVEVGKEVTYICCCAYEKVVRSLVNLELDLELDNLELDRTRDLECCLRLGRERFFFILLVIFLSCLLFIFVVFLPGS